MAPRRAVEIVLVAAIGATSLVACGSSDAPSSAAANEVAATVTAATETEVTSTASATSAPAAASASSGTDAATTPATLAGAPVPAAFDVQAPLVGGGSIDLAAYAGSPLVLWFWAPF